MTSIIAKRPERRGSVRLATGVAIAAFLVLGTLAAPAGAEEHHRGGGWDHHRGDRGHEGWNRGYYRPPVVDYYGGPYYAPPPVVYGPSVGIYLPGLSIGVR